jgi:predicted deacylase
MRVNTGELREGGAEKTRERRVWFLLRTPLVLGWVGLASLLGTEAVAQVSAREPLEPAATATTAADPALPVTRITGRAPGPTVAIVAGVHGGKVAAVRAVDSLRAALAGRLTHGRVLLVAPANVAGFRAGLAQLSPLDSLNLNRVFPGRRDGRPTERLAARLMQEIVSQSDYLLDLHGSDGDEAVGSFAYAARPGIDPRVDSAARALAESWMAYDIVWDEDGPRRLEEARFLQTAAHLSGVPAITVFEEGSTREDRSAMLRFVAGVERVLHDFGMLELEGMPCPPPYAPMLFARRAVVSATGGGTWRPATRPRATLAPGEPAGWLRSSSGVEVAVPAPDGGVVLHLRNAGPVRSGTPLVITAVDSLP